MPIEFSCTQCGKQLRTPDETAGKNAKCPQCGAIMQIPATSHPAAQEPPAFGPSPFGSPPPQPEQAGWNPYASPNIGGPSAAPGPTAASAGIVPTRVDFGRLYDVAWRIYKTKIGFGALVVLTLLVIGVVVAGIGMVLGMGAFAAGGFPGVPGQGGQPQIGMQGFGVLLVIQLIGTVFQTWLEIGLLRCFLNICRGGSGQLSDLFSGGKWLGRSLVIAAIYFVLGIAMSLPGVLTNDVTINLLATVIGNVVLVTVLLFIGQAVPLIVDKDMDVGTALTTSMEIMAGNKLMAVAVYIVTWVCLVMFCAVTCLIGAFFAIPLAITIRTVFYMHAAGQPTVDPQPPGAY